MTICSTHMPHCPIWLSLHLLFADLYLYSLPNPNLLLDDLYLYSLSRPYLPLNALYLYSLSNPLTRFLTWVSVFTVSRVEVHLKSLAQG